MMILNKIQDLQFEADIYVRRRTDGFITADRVIHPELANIEAPKEELNRIYARIEANRIAIMRAAFKATFDARVAERRQVAPGPAFMEAPSVRIDREFAHKALQKEIDEPLSMQMDGWVRGQMQDKVERFGFVFYRLAYKESDDEWDAFVKKLETALNSGLEGVNGIDEIKPKMTLHWIDGRDEKIAEGDIDAARK